MKIEEIAAKLKAEGHSAKAWGKPGMEVSRIYFNIGRRDVKIFLDFSGGQPELKIFIDDCGQHPNWYVTQREKLRGCMAEATAAATTLWNLTAEAVCAN